MRSLFPFDRGLLLTLGILLLITIAAVAPVVFTSSAASNKSDKGQPKSKMFGDYDIRRDKNSHKKIAEIRGRRGKSAAEVADLRDKFVTGEKKLKARVPTLVVEYDDALKVPEVIAPDPKMGKAFLTPPGQEKRSEKLRGFLRDNADLTGLDSTQIEDLKVASDYKNPEDDLGIAELEQDIDGIPVFRGGVKAGFTKNHEIVRIINNLAPGIDSTNVSNDFGDARSALLSAANNVAHQFGPGENISAATEASPNKVMFGSGDFAPTAEKMYFPIEPGVAVPAWRVLVWEDDAAYYVIVDAQDGTALWRKNITDSQTQSATFNVYANPNAMVNIADSPFPMTPGPTSPNGVEAGPLARTLVTRIGNEAPYTFNNLGWITDGNNTTDGNNVQAGLDRESPNSQTGATVGIDPNGVPSGTNRVFDFPFNPGVPVTSGSPSAGDSPLPAGQSPGTCQAQGTATAPTDYQKAVVTQLFYIANWYHDETYRLGFTEAAGNFQNDNFGRGGVASDRVSAESQDCSGTNNANFSTPADGGRGRMQMYIWVNPTPDFDGSLDADVVIHELTHGLSNRLHGNGSGLSGLNMSRAMGEGWSDFFAHAMLSEPSDPINGIYQTGGYATYNLRGGANLYNNYYYGIRRFPKAVMAFTGPNGKPHNPLTFNDVDATKINLSDGAFAPAFTTASDGVHAAGEVWSSALWEVRAKYVQRLGWAVGNRRVLQHVTDGMKLAPISPTFLQERDAIAAAAIATGDPEDVADVWAGFAIRGMGWTASIQNSGGSTADGSGTGQTRVTEAFDGPNLIISPDITVSDATTGDNDGFFEPGETVKITVSLKNVTGLAADNVNAQIVGGGSAAYGSIAHNGTASNQINYTIPANTQCGAAVNVTINVNSTLGPTSFNRTINTGQAVSSFAENFDGVSSPALPAGWSAVQTLNGPAFVTTPNNVVSAPNALFAAYPTTSAGGSDITTPPMAIGIQAADLSFGNRYDTEAGWDGGVLEISIAGGPFTDIVTAGGSFIDNGYNAPMAAATSTASYTANPLQGRNGWTGNSSGYLTTKVRLPAAAAGQNVQFKFRFGADDNTAGAGANPGWYIDNMQLFGNASCSFTAARKTHADFDGDGRADLSVYRPTDSTWHVAASSNGAYSAVSFGVPGDIPVPGDYDGDGKTDRAVWRSSDATWYFLNANGGFSFITFGLPGDVPTPADYDGDGKTDLSVWRPSDQTWFYVRSSNSAFYAIPFGIAGDKPVPADYDGDLKADLAVFRQSNSTWYIVKSIDNNFYQYPFGIAGDQPVQNDFDGDGRCDIAVYRSSDSTWYFLTASFTFYSMSFGLPGDVPAPADFDGDGATDVAVYRGGTWFYIGSKNSAFYQFNFGISGDTSVPTTYLPKISN
jgi:hypothetical protein